MVSTGRFLLAVRIYNEHNQNDKSIIIKQHKTILWGNSVDKTS